MFYVPDVELDSSLRQSALR